jgi:hypothetical protein
MSWRVSACDLFTLPQRIDLAGSRMGQRGQKEKRSSENRTCISVSLFTILTASSKLSSVFQNLGSGVKETPP